MKLFSWINEQIEWLKSFFGDIAVQEKASMKRLLSFIVVVMFCRAYFMSTWKSGKIEDIPETWAFVIIGLICTGLVDKWITWKTGGKNEPPK